MANVKVTNAVTNTDGVSGASNIANMRMLHFKGIYNELNDKVAKSKLSKLLNDTHKR